MMRIKNGTGVSQTRKVLLLVEILCLCVVGSGFCYKSLIVRRTQRLTSCASEDAHETIRLNKVFKATHSRRQADDIVASGRVTVNGEPVDSAGRRVIPYRDVIRLDGDIIHGWEALNACTPVNKQGTRTAFEYIKYWKPCGVTCTTDRSIPSNILDRLEQDDYRPDHRVYPVGRLDKDTSGLIILTSDGRLPNSALRGRYKQPKTYEVLVNYAVTNDEVQKLRDGVVITTQAQRDGKRAPPLTAKTKPCIVETLSDRRKLRMTLVEGRNRQIRRMIASLGLRVEKLHRCEFMSIKLAPLQGPGDWAPLSPKELEIVSHVIASAEQESETLESW